MKFISQFSRLVALDIGRSKIGWAYANKLNNFEPVPGDVFSTSLFLSGVFPFLSVVYKPSLILFGSSKRHFIKELVTLRLKYMLDFYECDESYSTAIFMRENEFLYKKQVDHLSAYIILKNFIEAQNSI